MGLFSGGAGGGRFFCLAQDFAEPPALRLRDDVAGAARNAAATRVARPFAQRKSVVERDLLADHDVPHGDDPDMAAAIFGAAVGRARMIDEPRRSPIAPGIEVMAQVKVENRHAAVPARLQSLDPLLLPATGFRFGDFFSDVFDDPSSGGNQHLGVNALAVDAGLADANPARVIRRRGARGGAACFRRARTAAGLRAGGGAWRRRHGACGNGKSDFGNSADATIGPLQKGHC